MISATVNALVRGSRKNAANCDTHCEVRNSENLQDFERILYAEATQRISGSVFVAPFPICCDLIAQLRWWFATVRLSTWRTSS